MAWEGKEPCSELAAAAGALALGARVVGQGDAAGGGLSRSPWAGRAAWTGSTLWLYTEYEKSQSTAEEQHSCFLFLLLFTACFLVS